MPRIARKNFENLYFHIIVQGINKEYIFDNKSYMEKYKKLIKYNTKNSIMQVLSYCIMSNHAHLLVYAPDKSEMGKIMQKINTSYAKYYNKINDRTGIVFKNRYYTQPIIDRKQLINCLIYIHNNPVNAKIIKQVQDYQYSSYNEWINEKDIISNQCTDLVFGNQKIEENIFNNIHLRNLKNIKDIEEVTELLDYKEILKEYLKNERIEYILMNEKILANLVKDLNEKSGISIRKISEILKVNRPKIMKLLKNLKNNEGCKNTY